MAVSYGQPLLDQLDREVQVDVVPGRQRHRVARVVTRRDRAPPRASARSRSISVSVTT